MDTVEEPPLHNPQTDGVKSTIGEKTDETVVASVETNVCHKSNGVAESGETIISEEKVVPTEGNKIETKTTENDSEVVNNEIQNDTVEPTRPAVEGTVSEIDSPSTQLVENSSEELPDNEQPPKKENNENDSIVNAVDDKKDEPIVETESIVETVIDRVTFETEVVVESNDNDVTEAVCEDNIPSENEVDKTHILSELGENIVLSEALRSSDVTDNVENNNCTGRQEVFNKEELLDILEGNNEDAPPGYQPQRSDNLLETQLALQQLSKLKKKSKRARRSIEKIPRRKSEKKVVKQETISPSQVEKVEENIVSDIVKDWDDEESAEIEKSFKLLDESQDLLKNVTEVINVQESRTTVDSPVNDDKTVIIKGDDGAPQRRLGRVIKKKVIFDPDNPDTFTKSKVILKTKESQGQEKDQTASKKIKLEQTFQRSKSKSPLSKLQWKKPTSKTIKQNKRLSEVDKLLMDEGAVNMIYQLTPEAPKGRKNNMKTKAEFIKKIQSSSTPDTKEMKFRERKKECKYEEGEARRIFGVKQRPSLNSSVKSPSVSEDFEAHSADDSIIYRRHSSSSYSSSCMSPRRLSDVEINLVPPRNAHPIMEVLVNSNEDCINEVTIENTSVNSFVSDTSDPVKSETINKDDCLSIKQKLNSKLNLALNKRKRENSKVDKPPKQKKLIKTDKNNLHIEDFKYLLIKYDGKLAIICVQMAGSLCNVEVITELEKALKLIDFRKDISITLIMPDCGTIYSDLDTRSLLDDNLENRTHSAFAIAEAIRSLLYTVEQHSKLLCTGAIDRCSGIALALIGLSDVALASELATFTVTSKSNVLGPAVSVLTSYCKLPQSLLTDLVMMGRRLSATEALQGGLISRTLWPENFNEQLLAIVKDIASQPAQNIWLKKRMLSLKKSGSESFLKSLEQERDHYVEYWTSTEGQQLLRATYNAD